MEQERKTIFISYSWDGESHQEWVLSLADDLISKYGVNVLLDQYDLTAGKNMTSFMERSLEAADKVLIILTLGYKLKAQNRKGGAGFEYSIISQELYTLQDNNEKYIPVLRAGSTQDSAPGYIKTLIYHPMVNDNQYASDLLQLVRLIYDKGKIKRPALGSIPDFDKLEDIDPLIERANRLQQEEERENERLQFLRSPQAKTIADYTIHQLFSNLDLKAKHYREKTQLRFSVENRYEKAMLHSGASYSIRFKWVVQYYNSVEDAELTIEYFDGVSSLDNTGLYFPGEEPKRLLVERYSFNVDKNLNPKWTKKSKDEDYTSDVIIKNSFVWLMDKIERSRRKHMEEIRKRGI